MLCPELSPRRRSFESQPSGNDNAPTINLPPIVSTSICFTGLMALIHGVSCFFFYLFSWSDGLDSQRFMLFFLKIKQSGRTELGEQRSSKGGQSPH